MAKEKKGFVAIPRGLIDDLDQRRHKFSKIEAFLYISYNIRFAKGADMTQRIPCKKGQLVTSLRELAKAFLWSESAVRRFLFQLVENDYIVWTSYRRTTVITMKHLADESDIKEEEKRGDATSDAISDATYDATCDATNDLTHRPLSIVGDATCDATSDAISDANPDALVRVLYYNFLVTKKEEGNNNVSSRKASFGDKKTIVSKARAVYEEFYKQKINPSDKYYWTAEDGRQMKQLLQKIRFARSQRKMPCEDDDMMSAFKAFLESIKDKWILDHMKVGTLNSKYNEIVAAAYGIRNQSASMDVGRIITEYDENKFKNKDFFK